jgi:hypothetical protein
MKPTVLKGALTSALTLCGIPATKGESFAAQHHREGSGNMIKKLLAVFALVLASITFSPANATNQLATAIGGHDAVAYFDGGAPKPGEARFHHFWNGAVWFFSSEKNRDTFSVLRLGCVAELQAARRPERLADRRRQAVPDGPRRRPEEVARRHPEAYCAGVRIAPY